MKTGINTPAIVAAREAYAARFDTISEAIEFENHVLGIGREFLPECALAVLDERATEDAPSAETVEYYTWLLEQANEAHDAADGDDSDDSEAMGHEVEHAELWQAENKRLLAEVERTYEAAKGQWTGREWHVASLAAEEASERAA